MSNPILEESTEIVLHRKEFVRLHVGYLVALLIFLVIAWPGRSYMYFFRMESVPPVFLANTVFVLLASCAVSVLVGTDRVATAQTIRYSEWIERTPVPVATLTLGKLVTALLHTGFLVALGIPVLIAAAGPSGVPLTVLPGVLTVTLLSALSCRIAAMIVSHLGEESYFVRTTGVWIFAALLFVLTLRLFRPMNPIVAVMTQLAAAAPELAAGGEPSGTAAGIIGLMVVVVTVSLLFWAGLGMHRRKSSRRHQ